MEAKPIENVGFQCDTCSRIVSGKVAPWDFREITGDIKGPIGVVMLKAGIHWAECIKRMLALPSPEPTFIGTSRTGLGRGYVGHPFIGSPQIMNIQDLTRVMPPPMCGHSGLADVVSGHALMGHVAHHTTVDESGLGKVNGQ
jgi:hypothetical protein